MINARYMRAFFYFDFFKKEYTTSSTTANTHQKIAPFCVFERAAIPPSKIAKRRCSVVKTFLFLIYTQQIATTTNHPHPSLPSVASHIAPMTAANPMMLFPLTTMYFFI